MTTPPHHRPDDESGIELDLTPEQLSNVRRIAKMRRIAFDEALRLVMDEGLRQVQLRELAGLTVLPIVQRRH